MQVWVFENNTFALTISLRSPVCRSCCDTTHRETQRWDLFLLQWGQQYIQSRWRAIQGSHSASLHGNNLLCILASYTLLCGLQVSDNLCICGSGWWGRASECAAELLDYVPEGTSDVWESWNSCTVQQLQAGFRSVLSSTHWVDIWHLLQCLVSRCKV